MKRGKRSVNAPLLFETMEGRIKIGDLLTMRVLDALIEQSGVTGYGIEKLTGLSHGETIKKIKEALKAGYIRVKEEKISRSRLPTRKYELTFLGLLVYIYGLEYFDLREKRRERLEDYVKLFDRALGDFLFGREDCALLKDLYHSFSEQNLSLKFILELNDIVKRTLFRGISVQQDASQLSEPILRLIFYQEFINTLAERIMKCTEIPEKNEDYVLIEYAGIINAVSNYVLSLPPEYQKIREDFLKSLEVEIESIQIRLNELKKIIQEIKQKSRVKRA